MSVHKLNNTVFCLSQEGQGFPLGGLGWPSKAVVSLEEICQKTFWFLPGIRSPPAATGTPTVNTGSSRQEPFLPPEKPEDSEPWIQLDAKNKCRDLYVDSTSGRDSFVSIHSLVIPKTVNCAEIRGPCWGQWSKSVAIRQRMLRDMVHYSPRSSHLEKSTLRPGRDAPRHEQCFNTVCSDDDVKLLEHHHHSDII